MQNANCGLIIDGDTLVALDGAITLADSSEVKSAYSSVCGGLCYDENIFKITNGILTIQTDEKTEFNNIVTASCGLKLDGEYFQFQNGKLSTTYTPQQEPSYYITLQNSQDGVNDIIMYKYKLKDTYPENQRFAILINPNDAYATKSIYSNEEFYSVREKWYKPYGLDSEYEYESEEDNHGSNLGGGGVYQHTLIGFNYPKNAKIIVFNNYTSVYDYVKNGNIDNSSIVTIYN